MIVESGPISAETPLADAEKRNLDRSATLGIGDHPSLSALRAIGDTEMMSKLPGAGGRGAPDARTAVLPMMGIVVDGWVLPEAPTKTYTNGHQQKVALMIGNNSQEMQGGRGAATAANLAR